MLKKIITHIAKKFYKYDPRYEIKKMSDLKRKKTIVLSVDHSWNSVEWCLPGLYYLKKHYDVNLVFLAADRGIWHKCEENKEVYSILEQTADFMIINTQDEFEHNWIQRKKNRLWKSLLDEESLKYFFGNIKVDILLELMIPSYVHRYFKKYHPDTIRVTYEHVTSMKIADVKVEYYLSSFKEGNYQLCTDNALYDIADEDIKSRISVIGAGQLDDWWIELTNKKSLLELQEKLNNKNNTVLILLPALGNERLYNEDKLALIKAIRYLYENENILLKFHPREKPENRLEFARNICDDYQNDKIFITTLNTECVAKIADCVVVVGATSSAGAAVINDVPVIEFHSNKPILSFYEENGQYGSLLKLKNAIMSAEDYDSLVAAINGVLYHNAWDMYRGRYKEYINHDNKASQRFAEALIKIMEQ